MGIGAALLWAGATGNLTSPVILLAVGCTVVLAAVDGVFYLQGVIARVYLLTPWLALAGVWLIMLSYR